MGAGLALMTTALSGVATGMVGAVQASMGFEKQISAISAVSGASSEDLAKIRDLALDLGKATSFSAKEAATGIEEMVKAGVKMEDVMAGAGRAALDLAAAGGLEVGRAAEIASNAMNTFSLKGADMAHVADVIAGAANSSAIDVGDFGFSMSAAGAVAATVGIGFEDLADGIAIMGQAGLKGSDAGTSLKTMLLNLNPTSNKARAVMNELGLSSFNAQKAMDVLRSKGIEPVSEESGSLVRQLLTGVLGIKDFASATDEQRKSYDKLVTSTGIVSSSFFDATGKAKSLAEISQELQDHTKDLTESQRIEALQTIFGTDAIRAAAIMSKVGAAGFNEMHAAIGNVTAMQVANERLNNLSGSWEQLTGSLETGAIILGSMVTPALRVLVDMATGGVNQAIEILERLPVAFNTLFQIFNGADMQVELAELLGVTPETAAEIHGILASIGEFFKNDLIPAMTEVAKFLKDSFTDLLGWFRENLPLLGNIYKTEFGIITGTVRQAAGEDWRTPMTEYWIFATGQATARVRELGLAIRAGLQIMNGDWQGAWESMTKISETEQKRQLDESNRNALLAQGVIDKLTGGMLTRVQTDFGTITKTISDAWTAVYNDTSERWGMISGAVSTAWETMKSGVETVGKAFVNVVTAIWTLVYDSAIKPKVDAINAYVDEKWQALVAATKSVLDPFVTYVRDTIFDPIRSFISDKMNAASTAFDTAVKAISAAAHTVFDPMIKWWNDTIFGPMSAKTADAMDGANGVKTKFVDAVNTIKGMVDGTLAAVKSTWETTWGAIQKAAESPQKAMEVMIELVDKLKKIMPEWLIPHSPTPFEMGLRGITDAARSMDSAFSGLGAGSGLITAIAAMGTGIGGGEFGRAAAAISASETMGGKLLVQQGGTGAMGPFQFDPGGELRNFARDLGVSMAEAARIAVSEPMKAAAWALNGYLGDALREGIRQNLTGAALAIYGSKKGQRPAEGNELKAGEWYNRLYGYASGGIAWSPQIARLAEREPELIVPLSRVHAGSGSNMDMREMARILAEQLGPIIASSRPINLWATENQVVRKVQRAVSQSAYNHAALRGVQ